MKMVKNAKNWKIMAGDTDLTKRLNSLLTCHYIAEKDVPDDECLSHATAILAMPFNRIYIAKYLLDSFGTYAYFPSLDDKVTIFSNVDSYWIAAGKVLRCIRRHWR